MREEAEKAEKERLDAMASKVNVLDIEVGDDDLDMDNI